MTRKDIKTITCICENPDCGKEFEQSIYKYKSNKHNYCSTECKYKGHQPSSKRIDMTGNRYGKLVVLEMLYNYKSHNRTYCKCICDCGNERIAKAQHLRENKISSCGCDTESRGELYIKEILQNYKINFVRQYIIKDCRDKYPLKFDFAIFDDSNHLLFVCEYDGSQHYIPYENFGGEEGLQSTQRRDKIKDDYCNSNNINLLRLKYTVPKKEIKEIIINTYNSYCKSA